MAITSVLARRIERHEIHRAVCRYRTQGLACSTCTELRESAERAERRLAQLLDEVA